MCLWSWFFFFWIAKKMQMDGVTVATDKMLLKHFTGMKPWPEEKRRSCESTDEEDSRREKCSFNTEMDQFCLNAGDSPGQVSLMRRFKRDQAAARVTLCRRHLTGGRGSHQRSSCTCGASQVAVLLNGGQVSSGRRLT